MAQQQTVRTPAITWYLAIPVIGISLFGFGSKFLEFIETFRSSPEGAFAITPVVNYLLASAGFFCLLLWAGMQGMFKELERPKMTMLEIEEELNHREGADHLIRSATCRIPELKSSQNSGTKIESNRKPTDTATQSEPAYSV